MTKRFRSRTHFSSEIEKAGAINSGLCLNNRTLLEQAAIMRSLTARVKLQNRSPFKGAHMENQHQRNDGTGH
jgi:hypothetical protein